LLLFLRRKSGIRLPRGRHVEEERRSFRKKTPEFQPVLKTPEQKTATPMKRRRYEILRA